LEGGRHAGGGIGFRGSEFRPGRGHRVAARRGARVRAARGDPDPGRNGYINEYPAGRLWRDAKLYEIGAGTSEIRRMLIGREYFGETS
jgi:alkylation response protein AidB-like acyl-CoA dehydrogenase